MRKLLILLVLVLMLFAIPKLWAADISPRPGWVVMKTDKTFNTLEADLKAAIRANKMAVVTQAGPTAAAKARGITIPANKVIGVFNNDFAVRTLNLSTAAMIEAPIRFYLTENSDGTATLSYKTPTLVFSPYTDEGGEALMSIAQDLDTIFATIANTAGQ